MNKNEFIAHNVKAFKQNAKLIIELAGLLKKRAETAES